MFEAKVVADSVSPDGVRLTSLALILPRFVLAQLNTHGVLSKSTSSSRAIPVERMISDVVNNPVIPIYWGKNKRGMQASEEIQDIDEAKKVWLQASASAVEFARELAALGVHKQLTNRVLEPYMWARTIVTGTDWDNFMLLRRHHTTQPEMAKSANLMFEAREDSKPQETTIHAPFLQDVELFNLGVKIALVCSAARCARVSYLNHDGSSPDVEKDKALFEMLAIENPPHMSPLEHVGLWEDHHKNNREYTRKFRGWTQLRAILELDGWGPYEPVGSSIQRD